MSQILSYLARMALISGLLYGYYCLFLRNGAYHGYNRCYLLCASLISLLLPLVDIPILGTGAATHPSAIAVIHRITTGDWGEAVIIGRHGGFWPSLLSGQLAIGALYILGMGAFLVATLASLIHIFRISRKYPGQRVEGVRLFITSEPGTPFSFFRRVFWDRRLSIGSPSGQQVWRHELYHVRQYHSLDILWLEGLRILFWCNPFFHLMRKEIRAIHEFLADRFATSSNDRQGGYDQHEYAELLVWQAVGNPPAHFVHSFFNTHLKRRITMLTQLRKTRPGYFNRLMILPFLFLLFCAFATRLIRDVPGSAMQHSRTLTVVIDAGHGGFDNGTVSSDGSVEKNIVLSIAKKIRQLSPAYNVKVLMTRDQDAMAGNKTTIQDGLKFRADFANEHKADLFISIHVNNGGTEQGDKPEGVQVWLSKQNTVFQKSTLLGSAMIEEIKKTYSTDEELKERDEGIYVLKNTSMPSVLLECGNILNAKDRDFIKDESNQEKMARSILQGILRYEESLPVAYVPAAAADVRPVAAADVRPAAGADVMPAPTADVIPAPAADVIPAVAADVAPVPSTDVAPIAAAPVPNVPVANAPVPGADVMTARAPAAAQQDDDPQYPGGQDAWIKYLIANAKYPKEAVEKNIQARVLVRFRVETDGTVGDIGIMGTDPGYGLGAEAMRLVKESGKWMPAVKGGQIAMAYKEQPIVFKLDAK